MGLGDGGFRVALFRWPDEPIVIVGGWPLRGEAVVGDGQTGFRGWTLTSGLRTSAWGLLTWTA
jgi:hypothetical protein